MSQFFLQMNSDMSVDPGHDFALVDEGGAAIVPPGNQLRSHLYQTPELWGGSIWADITRYGAPYAGDPDFYARFSVIPVQQEGQIGSAWPAYFNLATKATLAIRYVGDLTDGGSWRVQTNDSGIIVSNFFTAPNFATSGIFYDEVPLFPSTPHNTREEWMTEPNVDITLGIKSSLRIQAMAVYVEYEGSGPGAGSSSAWWILDGS